MTGCPLLGESMNTSLQGADLARELASLSGWVTGSGQSLQASSFAGFAGEILAWLPADERTQAFSALAAASAQLAGLSRQG